MSEIALGIKTELWLLDLYDALAEFIANSILNEPLLSLHSNITIGQQIRQQESPKSKRAAAHFQNFVMLAEPKIGQNSELHCGKLIVALGDPDIGAVMARSSRQAEAAQLFFAGKSVVHF
jgi:hypothetical protein